MTLNEATSLLFKHALEVKFNVKNILFPSLLGYSLLPSEYRYERNVAKVRTEFMKIIRARKTKG
jgi:hypothetical protein